MILKWFEYFERIDGEWNYKSNIIIQFYKFTLSINWQWYGFYISCIFQCCMLSITEKLTSSYRALYKNQFPSYECKVLKNASFFLNENDFNKKSLPINENTWTSIYDYILPVISNKIQVKTMKRCYNLFSIKHVYSWHHDNKSKVLHMFASM